ncbi:protein ELYS isoform X2 [Notolabrus celidotus]|uniref:protein ELYS isoform X2 n=1 Tax=Notolabrus celidotus TaxID=1203425 RepID=UPI00148F655E|nr:protein ELYS isoform X2 [Notolabrus celidotus]
MHNLAAQVTSSLLPFPAVTVDALGEDEITLDSVLHGKFTVGRSGLAWLACGPHLEVVHAVTGERLSAYRFSGGAEHPPSVLAARDFSWLKRSGLLVGLEEAEGSVLCLYDLGLSRVVKAVVIPGRITAIEPLVSYGGASTSTQHLHQSLRWFFGIAAVVTDLGHVLLVDLCLDDLSCSQSELEASDLQVVTKSPSEIPRLREVSTRQGRHLCLQLNAPSGVGATALQYISRTNQLAVGYSDGYLQLWNMKALKKEYHSQLDSGRVPVHAFTFQEPENDPRNCCYLWAVQSSQDLEGDMVSLRLLQLAFSERKCLASGKILYEGLEYCEERYSQELSGPAFPLRAQATNTRLLSCQTIEKFRPHPDRDDSMNEVASPDTSVSIFSWQVRAYGQGTPSTFIGVFDINRWYHAQMPDSLRTGESLQNCPYLAVWSLDPVVQMVSQHLLLDVVVHERSLSRGLPYTCPPPEQYFNPTTYNFDSTCLLNSGIVHLTCSGYQKETLSFLKKAAPCSSDIISTSYSRCLMSGLLSSRLADTQASSLSQEEQLDAILSTAVETSSLGLITGCIKQWTAEEQPGSALNLRYILDWAWNKVVHTKEELDGICAPLFDSSSNFTDPQTMQLLQHSQRLLSNLSTIFHCLLSEAQELTQKGLVGLINKNMVSSLISKYAQVVLWFCRTGLLPEGSDDDALQISRPFYTPSVISNYYTIRREELTRLAKGKWCADCLMIDGLVGQCGERLTSLWKRDEGGTGLYPPPSLHALLDIYLLDNIDEAAKHAIVIYLLLDIMHSFPSKEGASVEFFPTAFAIPIGLVKLVQGLWLLDHHDHQSSFELLLHPAASQCQFEWQHQRVLQALMCQGQHSVALRYFHVTKPPISSTAQAKLCLSVLLHNRCLIEAWSLLRQHSSRLNMAELMGFLYESCQELGLIKEMLKLPLGLAEQECLEKFLQGTGGLQNRELLMVHYLQQANYIPALQLNHSLKLNLVNERDPKLKERSNTRNSILEQYGKVLPRVQRKLAMERTKPYQHSSAIHREVSRPQPLSTITKRSASEKVMSRAGFINDVLTKIEEVWSGKGATPQSSPSRRAVNVQSPKPSSSALPDPFLGTPITMTSKRKSRLMDLVVHPSCQTPRPLLSPPRPPSSWISPKSTSKAPELSLLQTPQVVKRARALAASGPVFSAFTPQSILRSSLRPTPVATPSASPGRSVTPPLRSKESRITFIEEPESPEPEKGIRWTNGMAADSEISLLTRGALLSKATRKTWSSQPAEEEEEEDEEEEQPHIMFPPPEGGIPSPELKCCESEPSSLSEVAAETKPSEATQARLSLSFDTSQASLRSTDTTLEYFDAPLDTVQGGEQGHTVREEYEEVVTMNIKGLREEEELEEKPSVITEQIPLQPSEDLEREEEEEVVREIREDDVLEEVMKIGHDQQTETMEVQPENEDEQGVESSSKRDAADLDHEDSSSLNEVCDQVTESISSIPEVKSQDQLDITTELDVQSDITEPTEIMEQEAPSAAAEPSYELEEDPEPSTDLTEFVQRHLFGSDMTASLTRSGIHDASQIETTFKNESLGVDEEDEPAAVEAPPMFGSQKSTVSVTSSEPTGTDSHSVVSVNDSEELSSPASEDEEDDEDSDQVEEEEEGEEDEDEEEEEEEEDSGSEVEIIEEVQGNGRLPPLQPSTVFIQQEHTHFLPSLSEQEAATFSLITPAAEIKMVEEDLEGEVVMVRLGADEDGLVADVEDDQGSSYMELKPSTTLLVPMELMEGQDGLVDGSQLGLPELQHTVQAELRGESHSSFSLMLEEDVEKDEDIMSLEDRDKDADTLPMEDANKDAETLPMEDADNDIMSLENLDKDAETPPINYVDKDADTLQMEDVGRDAGALQVEGMDKDAGPLQFEDVDKDAGTLQMEDTDKDAGTLQMEDVDKDAGTPQMEDADKDADTLSMEDADKNAGTLQMEDADKDVDTLSMEDTDKDADTLPMENDLQPSEPLVLSSEVDAGDDHEANPEVILLGTDDQDLPPLSDESCTEKPTEEIDCTDGIVGEEQTEPELEKLDDQAELQTDIIMENHDAEDVSEQKAEEMVMLTEDQEPASPSESLSPAEEEFPVVMDEEDSDAKKSSVVEEMREEEEEQDKPTPAEDQKEPQENGPVTIDTEVSPCAEMTVVKEEQQHEAVEHTTEESETGREETKRTRGRQRKHKDDEEEKPMKVEVLSSASQPEESSVPEIPTSQRKTKALMTPTRRTTRSRTVTFISPLTKETEEPQEDGKVEDTETSQVVPASPSRTPRKSKQKDATVQPSTPRRSARKAQQVPSKEEVEEVVNSTFTSSTSTASSPSRRRGSQRAASTRSQSSAEEASAAPENEVKVQEEQEVEDAETKVPQRASSKTSTPAKRRMPEANSPRRSSRRILSSSEVGPTPLEVLEEEEKEQDDVFASPVRRNSRTRQSSQISLSIYPKVKLVPVSLPQSAKKTRGETTEHSKDSKLLLEPELNSRAAHTNSHRPTRSKLWDHPEEDLPLLDSPLEVDSETPVADALIKRLQDEAEKQEGISATTTGGVVVTKIVRTSKRSSKSSVEQIESLLPVNDGLVPEPAEDESSPGENSFIYSPSRRRTRASRAESPGPSEESAAPVTRSKRKVVKEASDAPHDKLVPGETVEVEKDNDAKTRKTGKRTTKSKAVPQLPPIAQVDLISPLPSPADPPQRTQRRVKEAEGHTSSMNLRRKRIMDTVFTKPVTRRKKL